MTWRVEPTSPLSVQLKFILVRMFQTFSPVFPFILVRPTETQLITPNGQHGGAASPAAMAEREAPPRRLLKHKTWSPNMYREETWVRRQEDNRRRRRRVGRCNSVTDDDLDELRGCIDLGFGFRVSDRLDPKLAETFPALELFCAVNKQYKECLSRSSSMSSNIASLDSDNTTPLSGSPTSPPSSIVDLGEDPKTVKARLKQWAQVVACSVRQSSRIP